MCGLVGIYSNLITENHYKIFNHLIQFDRWRGEHSTGVAVIGDTTKEPTIDLFKEVGPPDELYFYHAIKGTRRFTTTPAQILLGHNRYATQGKVNSENAHPFEFENVVGAHNGTLPMYQLRDFEATGKLDVDSQILYNEISKENCDLGKVWERTDGAMALTFYDKVNKRLCLARNKQRPLYVAVSDDCKSIFWASESWMISVACGRNNQKITEIQEVPVETLHSFTVAEDGKISLVTEELPKYKVKPFSYPSRTQYSMYDDEYWDYYGAAAPEKGYGKSEQERIEAASKVVQGEKPPANFILKEAVAASDGYSLLIARSMDGREVKINIPINRRQEVKEKVESRKGVVGYYTSTKVFKQALAKDGEPDYFTYWCDVQWVAMKEGYKIVDTKEGGYTITANAPVTNVVSIGDVIKGFDGMIFPSKLAWEATVYEGCDCCQKPVNFDQHKNLFWLNRNTFLCAACKEKPQQLQALIN